MRLEHAALFLFAVPACSRPPAPTLPASPTPTPPPKIVSGGAPVRAADGRLEFKLELRVESGVVVVPTEIEAVDGGTGRIAWSRPTPEGFRHDDATDTFVPDSTAAPAEEFVNWLSPAFTQEIRIPVAYDGDPPASQKFRLRYHRVSIAELGTNAYVPPAIGDPHTPSREPRHPLGARAHSVEIGRWLGSGFFLREPGPLYESTALVGVL